MRQKNSYESTEDKIALTLGQYLRHLRTTHNLFLTDVASQTQHLSQVQRITPDWLSRAERDLYEHPSPEKLRTLARIYGIPETSLLKRAGYVHEDGHEVPELQRLPTNIQLMALRAAELSPRGLEMVADMIRHISELEAGYHEDEHQESTSAP
jgi:transcriptional regulator with XRE-family HTH domain